MLRSFAVPRGPSLDPADKRLAVETKYIPIEYLDFEAVIPEGNYGAGAMIVGDRGRVRSSRSRAGRGRSRNIDFEPSATTRGRFGLILTGAEGRKRQMARGKPAADPNDGIGGGREWLLLKKTDVHAKKGAIVEEQPRSVLSGLLVEELAESRDQRGAREACRGGGRQARRGRRASDDSDALHVERSSFGSRGVAL